MSRFANFVSAKKLKDISRLVFNVQKRSKYRMTVEVLPVRILDYPPSQDGQIKLIAGVSALLNTGLPFYVLILR